MSTTTSTALAVAALVTAYTYLVEGGSNGESIAEQTARQVEVQNRLGAVLAAVATAPANTASVDASAVFVPSLGAPTTPEVSPRLSALQALGKVIFHDTNLSEPAGMGCISCHDPLAGGAAATNPRVREGTVPDVTGRYFGPRKTPTAMYMAYSPERHYDKAEGQWIGGQFFDQRAGNLAEQAQGPFLNPVEMANPDRATVVRKLAASSYANLFREVFGGEVFSDVDNAYVRASEAIAAYERTPELNPFSAKYDYFLKGRVDLSAQELRGWILFNGKANCASCHPSTPSDGHPPLFTDFTSDNLGGPRNERHPYLTMNPAVNPDGLAYKDLGVGAKFGGAPFYGRHKVATLRNIAVNGPYFHNGVFTTLRDAIRFYNTACEPGNPDGWAEPEVADNRNCTEIGQLKLSEAEIDDLLAFLNTLTDGYQP